MYYILDCDIPESENGEALMRIGNTFRLGGVRTWKSGKRLNPERLTFSTPVAIEFEPLRGYTGPPVELLDLGIPLMSERLQRAVVDAGVSNVEWFDAVLRNTKGGQEYPYKIYNVVGLVAAADMSKSEWESISGKPLVNVSFDELVIDEARAAGALLFRLAENVNALMIAQPVRDSIERAGIGTVRFTAPQDWMQV
ncbi:MAG: hypothetical protein JNL85_11760 [Rubrivivax sp.]|nr:hypothetical protein [Rubrivivax sp.]